MNGGIEQIIMTPVRHFKCQWGGMEEEAKKQKKWTNKTEVHESAPKNLEASFAFNVMLMSQRKREAAHLQLEQSAAINVTLQYVWEGSGVNLGGVREGDQ